ncbi:MAG: uL15 family ribosomal protein [Candidatus Paceibacterota bacterium]
MQIQHLKRKNPLTKKRQIGRGGIRGTTSGRGTKGQSARAGHKIRPEIRDVIKKLPKKRGYRFNSFKTKPVNVNLATIDEVFAVGDIVSPATLVKKGIISRTKRKLPVVKILGQGALTKKVSVIGCQASTAAADNILAAGGKITLPAKREPIKKKTTVTAA